MITGITGLVTLSLIFAFTHATETRFSAQQQEQLEQQLGTDYTDDIFDYFFELLCGGDASGTGDENTDFCCPLEGEGPHAIECLANWWTDVGCSLEASSSPLVANVEWWNERSVAAVKEDMALYFEYAQNDQDYEVKCHGTVNPNHCNKTEGAGPHPMSCLIRWWRDAGCSLDGTHSPIFKPDLYFWQNRNVQAVKHDMALFFEYAASGYSTYSLKCFGQNF